VVVDAASSVWGGGIWWMLMR